MVQTSLADISFLANASADLRRMVTSLAMRKKLDAGVVLFSQGDPGDTLYAIISGGMEVSVLSPEGQKLSLDIMGPGEMFGEIALFSPGPRTATVTTVEPTEVWGLRNADVLAALRAQPDLYVDMIELAGKRMRWMSAQYQEQVFMDAPTRLARKILHYCGAQNRELRMSHAELASFVGTTRETVSKTLSKWKRDGILKVSRGAVVVLDAEALRKISQI